MERLTDKHYTGDGYYLICSGVLRCPEDCKDCDKLDEAIDRLGAYEDTGLTPEDIVTMQERMNENIGAAKMWCRKYHDLLQAEATLNKEE